MRGIAYNRDISDRKARHKKKLSDFWCHNYPMYSNLHQYSKNKIHCSCNLCASKTNFRPKRYGSHHRNWKSADKRKIDNMIFQEEEYMQSVMPYKKESTPYTDEHRDARPSDKDFAIKQQLYNEFKKALKEGFSGTYEEYLSYRDYI